MARTWLNKKLCLRFLLDIVKWHFSINKLRWGGPTTLVILARVGLSNGERPVFRQILWIKGTGHQGYIVTDQSIRHMRSAEWSSKESNRGSPYRGVYVRLVSGVLSLTDIVAVIMARMTTGKKLRNDLPAQWLCLFLTRAVFSKGRKFDLCESYPRIIPRIIPPNLTPKSYPKKSRLWMSLLGSFGIALASLVIMDLTS